jgi:hypothetical protein
MTDLSQKFGETTVTLNISTLGSWVGDLFLSLSSVRSAADQILLDDDQAHITVKEVGDDSLRITPPGASPVPLLYMALYEVMSEVSPTLISRHSQIMAMQKRRNNFVR